MTHHAEYTGGYRSRSERAACAALDHEKRSNGRNYQFHIRSVERVIRAMMSQLDAPMSNEQMADIACFSPCHFNRLFHKLTGIPPIQFHYALRLERAKSLLITTDLGVTQICLEVGYNSLGTFISRFNELVGLSPNAYRRFARQLAGMDLAALRSRIASAQERLSGPRCITGRINRTAAFDGATIIGLFRRGIPDGQPVECALLIDELHYSFPICGDGGWFVFAVGVPWTADAIELLTLHGLPRGRSGLLRCKDGTLSGDSAIDLRMPQLYDPPILVTLPLFLGSFGAREAVSVSSITKRDEKAVLARQAEPSPP